MKPSDLTLEAVRAAMERTAAPDWPSSRTLSTEDVLLVARGWDGKMRNWRPDTTGQNIEPIEGRHDACEAAIRKQLVVLVEQGLVWQSERGQRGYRWRWISDDDRRAEDARERTRAEFRELAERIARRVGDEHDRAVAEVGNYKPVNFHTYRDDEGNYTGQIEVRMDRELATAFAAWLEDRVRIPLVELPELSDDDLRALAASLGKHWMDGDSEAPLHVAGWVRQALDGDRVARRRCAYWIKTRGKEGGQ